MDLVALGKELLAARQRLGLRVLDVARALVPSDVKSRFRERLLVRVLEAAEGGEAHLQDKELRALCDVYDATPAQADLWYALAGRLRPSLHDLVLAHPDRLAAVRQLLEMPEGSVVEILVKALPRLPVTLELQPEPNQTAPTQSSDADWDSTAMPSFDGEQG